MLNSFVPIKILQISLTSNSNGNSEVLPGTEHLLLSQV